MPDNYQDAKSAPQADPSLPSAVTITTIPNKTRYSPKGIPISLLLEYADKQLSSYEIATLCGCSHVNVINRLKRIQPYTKSLSGFKDKRADIMALVQSKAIDNITDDKLKKASARDLTLITGILYDKERIERGLSTDNINIQAMTLDADSIAKQRMELQAKLASLIDSKHIPTIDNTHTDTRTPAQVDVCNDKE